MSRRRADSQSSMSAGPADNCHVKTVSGLWLWLVNGSFQAHRLCEPITPDAFGVFGHGPQVGGAVHGEVRRATAQRFEYRQRRVGSSEAHEMPDQCAADGIERRRRLPAQRLL